MPDLTQLREAVNEAIETRALAITKMEEAEGDEALDAAEAEFRAADEEVERRKKNLDRFEKVERAKAEEPLKVERAKPEDRIEVTRNEPIYREEGRSFFRDLLELHVAKGQNPDALERLSKNNRETADRVGEIRGLNDYQKRAISTSANAGGQFVAPVWLLDQYAAKLRAGRAYLNALGTRPFTNDLGNSINVPSITTGASVAAGTAENSAVTRQDLVTSSITAATQTISGQTQSSFQLIDLSQTAMDQIIMDDMTRDYTKKLDDFGLNSTTTNAKGILQVSGTSSATYTDASPTVPELYPVMFQGKSTLEKAVFAGVDFIAMHPSTWNWVLSGIDGNNRPLALSTNQAAFNATAGFDANAAQGLAGNFLGLPVIVDANFPVNTGGGSNQAPILMINRMAHDFWEGVPSFRVAEQTLINQLTYVFVMYGYAAQMCRQAAGACVVNGTGLIVQSGF